MATTMDAFNDYIKAYNQAVKSGDMQTAIRIGRKIIEIGEREVAREGVPDALKTRYASVTAKIREQLADAAVTVPKKTAPDGGNAIASTDWFSAEVPKLTLNDVAGLYEVRKEFVLNVFAPLNPKYTHIYHKYRSDMGLQILLYGPPGTGKTHIVKCLAGQLGCKIAVVQIKDVMANLVGDGAKIIASVFEQAKKYDRCIIFFDEIDAIAASRDDDESRHTKEQLTTLLTNMDGFTSGVKEGQIRIIVAATNRPWALDSAVKRGGRFDTQIYVPLPDPDARRKLIALALGKDPSVKKRVDVPCAPDVTIDWLVDLFDGYSGADIKAVCRQIVNRPLNREILAANKGVAPVDPYVTQQDCEYVIQRYINSITDKMLFEFDAYSASMDLFEYLEQYRPKAYAARAAGEELPGHVVRWLEALDREKAALEARKGANKESKP